jgi:hypothetical protein
MDRIRQKCHRKEATMAWYKQTAVWGLALSVTAMVLSQLPPIKSWIASDKVATEISSRLGLPNTLGIPAFQVFIDLKNSGNRPISITNLVLDITYPNGTVRRVKAQSYSKIVSGQTNSIEFPITSIALNPGLNWSELVSFYSDLSPSDEEAINRIRLQISQDHFSKIQARGGQYGPLVTANESIVAEATQFFDKKFDLEKGTYSVTIKCAVNGREVMLKQASFTLYDYHITTIKSQKEDFKFGAGIYYPTNQPKQVWALLSKAS